MLGLTDVNINISPNAAMVVRTSMRESTSCELFSTPTLKVECASRLSVRGVGSLQ